MKSVVKNYAGALAELVVRERFDNFSKISKVLCPILIIHGSDDEVVPLAHARQLQGSRRSARSLKPEGRASYS